MGRRSLAIPVALAMLAAPALVDCGGAATCDDACDNLLQKCGDPTDELQRNDCLEQCSQRLDDVPSECAAERDAMLDCVAEAESVDCGDAQQTAECSTQNDALVECSFGGSSSGSESSASSGGEDCETDDDCSGGVCNFFLEQCAAPGELGDPCSRDEECQEELCSFQINECAEPESLGGACSRDEECQDDLCSFVTNECAEPAGPDQPCSRDEECLSDTCVDFEVCG